jgi:hypothetical protein
LILKKNSVTMGYGSRAFHLKGRRSFIDRHGVP